MKKIKRIVFKNKQEKRKNVSYRANAGLGGDKRKKRIVNFFAKGKTNALICGIISYPILKFFGGIL